MFQSRACGILVHPTSFPGPDGIGDFGPDAYRMIDYLADAGAQVWQVLPLGPTGGSNSPYQLYSAFAGNPLLIKLERLCDAGWLDPALLAERPFFPVDRVDFLTVEAHKIRLLRAAFAGFRSAGGEELPAFRAFCAEQAWWLDDYALFMAARRARDERGWTQWEPALRDREPGALAEESTRRADDIAFIRFTQFLFQTQWDTLRQYTHERGIRVIGDVPIFVAHDSADVWAHPELFKLRDDGEPAFVAGVPPDYFSATGQRWGNPVYDWPAHAADGYTWWIARLRHALRQVDAVRLDHFLGFAHYWEIPAACPTAVDGRWAPGPGTALFVAVAQALGGTPFIAEDLGVITDEVRALQREFHLPGMAILQYAFNDASEPNLYQPHRYPREIVAYTGTHDNDTTVGWWANASERTRAHARRYLNLCDGEAIHHACIRALLASVANLAVIPLQDMLGLDNTARMNIPGQPDGNWGWRIRADQLSPDAADMLRQLNTLYERNIECDG